MKYVRSSSQEMALHQEMLDIIETLIPADSTVEEWLNYLDKHESVWKVEKEGVVLGFYTLRPEQLFGEGHAYFFRAHRRHSFAISRLMIAHVLSLGLIPKTTATSDFPHVVKFLKMLGFTQVGVELDGIIKPKGPVDVVYLMYLKL
ncbi:MAG: hypothetical protein ACRCZ2_08770 [Fusobacteriaceae bacterium]